MKNLTISICVFILLISFVGGGSWSTRSSSWIPTYEHPIEPTRLQNYLIHHINEGTIEEIKETSHWQPEIIDKNGNTMLLNQVKSGNHENVQNLINHNCDIYHINHEGLTAFDIAEANSDSRMLAILRKGRSGSFPIRETGSIPDTNLNW